MGVTKEELGALTREDLENTVAYYQPRFHAVNGELNRLKESERLLSRMKFWRRLRWALTKK